MSTEAPRPGEPQRHPELPDELVEAIAGEEYACVTAPTDEGTIFVVKAPGEEITRLSGPVPVEVRHELYPAATAPVIRTLLILYDDPHAPFALETYINIGDPNQRQEIGQAQAWYYHEDRALVVWACSHNPENDRLRL